MYGYLTSPRSRAGGNPRARANITQLKNAAVHCRGAIAAQKAGKNYRSANAEKQIQKFCQQKRLDTQRECKKFQDKADPKKIDYWCGRRFDTKGNLLPYASETELAAQLWEGNGNGNGEFEPSGDEDYDTGESSSSPLPLVGGAIAAILLFGGLGLFLTRKKS